MRNGSGTDQDRRERRRYKRTHVLMAGDLVSGPRAMRGCVLDISVSGAQMQLPHRVPAEGRSEADLIGGGRDSDVKNSLTKSQSR